MSAHSLVLYQAEQNVDEQRICLQIIASRDPFKVSAASSIGAFLSDP